MKKKAYAGPLERVDDWRWRIPRSYKPGMRVDGLIYVADEHNHAYLGPAQLAEVAAHISRSTGPSGSNTEYLLQLAEALRELGDHDPHVHALEALLTQ